MRILILNYEFPPVGGGGGRAAEDICRALARRGHEIRVQTSHVKGLPKFEERDGYRIYRSFSFRRRADMCSVWEMAAYLVTNLVPALRQAVIWRPDLIHAHFAVPTGVLAWAVHFFTGTPYVLTVQLGDVPGALPEQTDHLFRVVKPFTLPIWRRAAAVVAVSRHIRDIALNSYSVPIDIIPNAVDLRQWSPGPVTLSRPKRLVFAGRFNPQKNLFFLINVLTRIVDLDWHLDMLGDGVLMDSLRREIKERGLQGRITLHGWVEPDSVERIMGRSDILVLPSISEGLPLVGTMALGLGLAIIGSRVGGITDIVEDGGNGYLFAVNDLDAFERALRVLLESDDLLKTMKEMSRKMAGDFDLENVATRYEEIYERVKHSQNM